MKSVDSLIDLMQQNFTQEQLLKYETLSKIMTGLKEYKDNGNGHVRIENTEKILEIITRFKKV